MGKYRTDRPGTTPHGLNARKNMGISIVRENRELVLDDFFVRGGASGAGSGIPQNRWWGCEVRFDRGCDDLFGVDHNKQMASHFTGATKDLFNADRNSNLLDELGVGDDDVDIYNIASRVESTIRRMMDDVKLIMKPTGQKAHWGWTASTRRRSIACNQP